MFRSNLACNVQQQQRDMNGNGGGSSPSSLLSPSAAGSGNKQSLISSGCEEGTRNPEPKPRWNPRPEQIRILEGIFNSGMVNPPRDEIRRIRLQLQEYGQVGDANVFYWFQNRKSRTKNKLRAAGQLQSGRAALARTCAASPSPTPAAAPAPVTPPRRRGITPTASSSSDRSSGSSKTVKPATALASATAVAQEMLPATAINLLSQTPTLPPSCQLYYHSHPMPTSTALTRDQRQLTSPETLLQWPQNPYMPATELAGVLGSHTHTPVSPGLLLGLCNEASGQEIMDMSCSNKDFGHHYMDYITCIKTDAVSAVIRDDEKARLQGLLHYGVGGTATAASSSAHHHLAAPVHAADDAGTAAMLPITTAAASNNDDATNSALADQLQGMLDAGLLGGAPPPAATVLVAVASSWDAAATCSRTTSYSFPAMMHLNVRMFGEAAVLLRNTGEPVLVDDSGVTVEPLQQGALYYVLATEGAV
ncbi:hypothetical protein ABZP36_030178 [Zizania latifolia]